MKKLYCAVLLVMLSVSSFSFGTDYVSVAKEISYDSQLNMENLCQGVGDMYEFIMGELKYGPEYTGSDELSWRVDGKTKHSTIVKAENDRFVFTIPVFEDGDYYVTYMYMVSVYDKTADRNWDDIDRLIDYMRAAYGFRLSYIWK